MGETEKIIQAVEEVSGQNVSVPTLIAGGLALIAIFLWVYKQIWPIIRGRFDAKVQKRVQEENAKEKLKELEANQAEQEKQFGEMVGMMKDLTASMGNVSQQLSGISGENKLTLSVLLDMIECMQAKTSPEECAKRAQASINAYYREGKLPTTMLN